MDNEEAYRISRTGYFGDDGLVAVGLDSIYSRLIGVRPHVFDVWVMNDGLSYKLYWSRDGVLITDVPIETSAGDLMSSVSRIVDQILEESDAVG